MLSWTPEVSTCLKNKIQPNKFENLSIFIQELMNQKISHLENRRVLQGTVQSEGVYREKFGARELLAKDKKELFLD